MTSPFRFLWLLVIAALTSCGAQAPTRNTNEDEAKRLYAKGVEALNQGLCAADRSQIGLCSLDMKAAFEQPDFKPKPIAFEGLKLITQAHDLGNPDAGLVYAQCLMYGIFTEDYPAAIDLLGKLSAAGHPASQYTLAQELMNGRLAKDRSLFKRTGTNVGSDVEAFSLFLKAAESGNSNAQNSVAVCYQRGVGTERDPREALKWARRSAFAGNYGGQVSLAVQYINGDGGVGRDFDTAYAWLKIASDHTDLTSIYSNRIAPYVDLKRSGEIESRLRQELKEPAVTAPAAPTPPRR